MQDFCQKLVVCQCCEQVSAKDNLIKDGSFSFTGLLDIRNSDNAFKAFEKYLLFLFGSILM